MYVAEIITAVFGSMVILCIIFVIIDADDCQLLCLFQMAAPSLVPSPISPPNTPSPKTDDSITMCIAMFTYPVGHLCSVCLSTVLEELLAPCIDSIHCCIL